MTINLRPATTRITYHSLTPQEWVRLHGALPAPLQQLLVDDHADLSALVAPATAVVELLDWFLGANEHNLSPTNQADIEQLRQILRELKVSA